MSAQPDFINPCSLHQAPCYWFLTSSIFWTGSWAWACFHGNNSRSSEQNPMTWCSFCLWFLSHRTVTASLEGHLMKWSAPSPINLTHSQFVSVQSSHTMLIQYWILESQVHLCLYGIRHTTIMGTLCCVLCWLLTWQSLKSSRKRNIWTWVSHCLG